MDSSRFEEVSPNVFSHKNYRFFFFSLEESRVHVHVVSLDGEAKFWVEPEIELAVNKGFKPHQVNELTQVINEHRHEICAHWKRHFGT